MNLKDKKVLVTGADGFIGSHLVEALLSRGAKVKALVFYNSFNSWGWLDTFSKETLDSIEIVEGDIRDQRFMEDIVEGCEVIFHLAALISIPFSYKSPELFFDTNTKGTMNLLQAARIHGVKRILITSTSEVYGTAQYVPMDELHPLQAQSPYSASKIAGDHIGESFYRSFGVPVVTVRPFNAFGPRQSTRAVIPTIITQALSGVDEIKLGRIDTIRDFNYVKDTADAYCEIASSENVVGEEINIATGVGVSIGETAEKIFKILGKDINIKTDEIRLRPDSSEVERLIGSADKLKRITGFTTKYGLDKGLRDAVEWYSVPENLAQYKSNIYNI